MELLPIHYIIFYSSQSLIGITDSNMISQDKEVLHCKTFMSLPINILEDVSLLKKFTGKDCTLINMFCIGTELLDLQKLKELCTEHSYQTMSTKKMKTFYGPTFKDFKTS